MADGKDPLKIGFIGCGTVTAQGHLPPLQFLPSAKVVAVSDVEPERLKQVAERFHIERRYPDFRALLEDSTVEAVAVCVPVQFHADIALAALDAGKHVFIEKPLALNLDDCDRLISRAAKSSLKATVGFNLRCHRLVRNARAMIQQGQLGRIQSIRSVLTSGSRFGDDAPEWRKKRKFGGGEFFETAVHHFDLWRFLFQTEVDTIFANSRSGDWDDETILINAQLANGCLASGMFSTCTANSSEVEVYGEKARLSLSLLRFDGLELLSGGFSGDMQSRLAAINRVVTNLPGAVLGARKGGDFLASYRGEWQYFVDSIRKGLPLQSTLEDGRRALQLTLAAIESAGSGRPVRIAGI